MVYQLFVEREKDPLVLRVRDLISEIGRFRPDEDTPLRNGHLCIADRDIFPFFSLYHCHYFLVLDSPVGFGVFYSYFYPSFYFPRFEYFE